MYILLFVCINIYAGYTNYNCMNCAEMFLIQWLYKCGMSFCMIPISYFILFYKFEFALNFIGYLWLICFLFDIIWFYYLLGLETVGSLWIISFSGIIMHLFSVLAFVLCEINKSYQNLNKDMTASKNVSSQHELNREVLLEASKCASSQLNKSILEYDKEVLMAEKWLEQRREEKGNIRRVH